jgi:hypothetical protein
MMSVRENLVPLPPRGMVLAIQYWSGDEAQAMRLARLLADIEPARRDDVTMAFCGRFDVQPSQLLEETALHCGFKFKVMAFRSRVEGVGHPAGSNALWTGVMAELAEAWRIGMLDRDSVFMIEADGCPVAPDWLDRLKTEHEANVLRGKRVTGVYMTKSLAHINGSLLMHLSTWFDRRSLRHTPLEQAWDFFHAPVLMAEANPSPQMLNAYGSTGWPASVLGRLGNGTAWLCNTKDDSVLTWAEKHLVHGALGTEDPTPASRSQRVSVQG